MPKNGYAIILSVALVTSAAAIAYAADDPPTSVEANISGNVKIAAAAAKRDAKVVGTAVKEGAEKIGVEAKKVAHEVTNASKKGAREVKAAAKDIAAKTKAVVKSGPADQPDKKPAQ